MPEFSEAWACLCKEYLRVPGWNLQKAEKNYFLSILCIVLYSTYFFFGLNVFPLSKKWLKLGKFIMLLSAVQSLLCQRATSVLVHHDLASEEEEEEEEEWGEHKRQ